MSQRKFDPEAAQLALLVFGSESMEDHFEEAPWKYQTEEGKEYQFRFWYEGIPEYLKYHGDYNDYHAGRDYRTAVYDCTYGTPAETVLSDGESWELVGRYQVSAERPCPCHKDSGNDAEAIASIQSWIDREHGGTCPYCEEKAGAEHGYVYVGEGMFECLYRREKNNADIATDNHVEWWSEEAYEVTCKCGVYTVNAARAEPFPTIDCPSCGADVREADVKPTGQAKWWWWTCMPGCLPDSDVFGPFDSEAQCLTDAVDHLR